MDRPTCGTNRHFRQLRRTLKRDFQHRRNARRRKVFADFESVPDDGLVGHREICLLGRFSIAGRPSAGSQGKINPSKVLRQLAITSESGATLGHGASLAGGNTFTSTPFISDFRRDQFCVGGGAHREKNNAFHLLIRWQTGLVRHRKQQQQIVTQYVGRSAIRWQRSENEVVDNHNVRLGQYRIDHTCS